MGLPRIPSSVRVKRANSYSQQPRPSSAPAEPEHELTNNDRLSEEIRLAERAIRDQEESSSSALGSSPPRYPIQNATRRQSRSVVEDLATRHRDLQHALRKEKKRRRRSASSSLSSDPISSEAASTHGAPRINELPPLNNVPEESSSLPGSVSATSRSQQQPDADTSAQDFSYFNLTRPTPTHATRHEHADRLHPTFYVPTDGVSPFSAPVSDDQSSGPQPGQGQGILRQPTLQKAPPVAPSKSRATIASFRSRLGSLGFTGSNQDHNNNADNVDLEALQQRGKETQDTGNTTPSSSEDSDMHTDAVVDYLDVVDPEISTVTTLQNVGNSIFFPPIPMLYSRRPAFNLPSADRGERRPLLSVSGPDSGESTADSDAAQRRASRASDLGGPLAPVPSRRSTLTRMTSMVSLSNLRRKNVPETTEEERRKHIKQWAEMDVEERNELDEHVRMLLSKKSKFKRAARGFWRYVRTPHGFIITLYGFLITFWGTAICLFLLRWIDVGNKDTQRYWIEICDQILCALFAAVGIGFAPFRAVDTYRMAYIAHYHFLTYKKRRALNLPELKDKNELPRSQPRLTMAQRTMNAVGLGGRRASAAVVDSEACQSQDQAQAQAQNQAQAQTQQGSELTPVRSRGLVPHRERNELFSQEGGAVSIEMTDEADRTSKEDSPRRGLFGRTKKSKEAKKEEKHSAHPSGYTDQNGVIPLGQLRRNPSIASELPKAEEEEVVLTPKQQANLEHQQRKFHASHTFYRYRETVTHRPFELSIMMTVVILLDCHSCLQASLGGT